jgi:hypothetical protein
MRDIAKEIREPVAKAKALKIAKGYDGLARRAQRRSEPPNEFITL